MATMAGKVRQIRDADPAVELRAPATAAATATGQSAAKELGTLATAYWDNNEIPWDDIGAHIVVQSLDTTTGDETYVFSLEVSTDVGFTTPIKVAEMSITAIGAYSLIFDAKTVKARLNGAKYVRLKHTLAGTTPIVSYYSWLFEC